MKRRYAEGESFWSWLQRWSREPLNWARYERGHAVLPPEGHPDRDNPMWVEEAIATHDIRTSRRKRAEEAAGQVAPYTWAFCRSCGGAGWIGSRFDHRHPDCGHRCILCDPPPGYDRTYAVEAVDATRL